MLGLLVQPPSLVWRGIGRQLLQELFEEPRQELDRLDALVGTCFQRSRTGQHVGAVRRVGLVEIVQVEVQVVWTQAVAERLC